MLQRMARHNLWANRRLYAACAELDDSAYFQARPCFFGSIHKTLNHVLVADRLWLARIESAPPPGLKLDAELYRDRAELRGAREAQDQMFLELLDALDETGLSRRIDYRNSAGKSFSDELELVLQHVFNHQTHHRGQVHDLLSATPVPPPPLDLILYVREQAASAPSAVAAISPTSKPW